LRKSAAASVSESEEELVEVSLLEESDEDGVGARLRFLARARFAWLGRLPCFFFAWRRRGFFFSCSVQEPDGPASDAGGTAEAGRDEAEVTECADGGRWVNGGW
jgi:hypothetical protein